MGVAGPGREWGMRAERDGPGRDAFRLPPILEASLGLGEEREDTWGDPPRGTRGTTTSKSVRVRGREPQSGGLSVDVCSRVDGLSLNSPRSG